MRIQIPSRLSLDEAASLPVAIAAAVVGLYASKAAGGAGLLPPFESSNRGREAGKALLILGGATSVGQFGELPVLSSIVWWLTNHDEFQ